jgi:hypothetical protein
VRENPSIGSNDNQQIANTAIQADKAQTAGYKQALESLKLEMDALHIEQARIQLKYGKESERAAEIASRAAFQKQIEVDYRTAYERSRIEIPPEQPGVAIVHGRVMTPDGSGVEEVAVRLLGADKKTDLGTARTAGMGHFVITVKLEGSKAGFLEVRPVGSRVVIQDPTTRILTPETVQYAEIVVEPPSTGKPPKPPEVTVPRRTKASPKRKT